MSLPGDITVYMRLTAVLASVGAIIAAAEMLRTAAAYSTSGIYDWTILRTSEVWTTRGPLARLADALFRYPRFLAIPVCQLVCAALFLAAALSGAERFSALFAGGALAAYALLNLRNQYGLDGSDQMQVILFAGLFVFYLSDNPLSRQAAVMFIAAQSLLSYVTAGVAKAISPIWRSGAAIPGITNTTTYGSRAVAAFFRQHRRVSLVVCWAVILFECLGPLLALTSPQACLVFVALGAAFHAINAVIMGLNSFFWAFGAAYPAVVYAVISLHSLIK